MLRLTAAFLVLGVVPVAAHPAGVDREGVLGLSVEVRVERHREDFDVAVGVAPGERTANDGASDRRLRAETWSA